MLLTALLTSTLAWGDFPVATGGDITTNGGYRIHTFTNNGTFKVTGGSVTCDVLVVAGGGAGGYWSGGGGGVVYSNGISIGEERAVVVGAGGIGNGKGVIANIDPAWYPVSPPGGSGSNSSFEGMTTAIGGGGGGGPCNCPGSAGGSGGGGGAWPPISAGGPQSGGAGTVGQGYAGGYSYRIDYTCNGTGGGGGAGEVGEDAGNGYSGDGGEGKTYDISGESKVYGSGGGGAGGGGNAEYWPLTLPGTGGTGAGAGATLTPSIAPGNGTYYGCAGGGASTECSTYAGGDGYQGVVIVRYLIAAPAAPTGLTASDGTYTDKVRITWTAANGATGYQIYRNTSSNSDNADQIGATVTNTYNDTGASAGTTYYYWVKATNSLGTSEFSAYDTGWCAQPATVPLAPTGVSASDGTYTDKVALNWNTVADATGYQIFRHTIYDSASADQIGTATSTIYDDTNAVTGTTYYYWVKATNSAGASGFSAHDTGWRAQSASAPSVPTGLSASDGTYTDKVALNWNTVADAAGYQIYRHVSNNSADAAQIGTAASNTYDDTGAVADTIYYYWVKATNSAGASGFSASDAGYRTPTTSTLAAPTNVAASDGTYTNKVLVTWSAVSGAGNYEVWRNILASTNSSGLIANTVATTYDDTNVTANVSYYYWVRAKNPSVTSEFSLPNSGYASTGNAYERADLSVLSFLFLPAVMCAGDHPGAVSVQLINYGTDNLAFPNTRVAFDFYLSANTTFGDADDVWMGDYGCDQTLAASTYTTMVVPTSGQNGLTVPTGLTGGSYYVFARVQHSAPSTLMDPDLSNNYVMRSGAITIKGSSSTGYHLFNDYDRDGKSDVALYKESTGEWLILLSGSAYSPVNFTLGGPGFTPVLADYDGDGQSDPAVCRRSTGEWQVMLSGDNYQTTPFMFGENGCIPVALDYDGDGKADPTVYREDAGAWMIMCSAENYVPVTIAFGGHGRTPLPADYDGDCQSDLATYRDSTGDWAVMFSSMAYWTVEFRFGGQGNVPIPADYDGDGKADPAVYKESTGDWAVMMSRFNYLTAGAAFGGHGWVPVFADYDGDGKEDVAIYNDGLHLLKVLVSGSNYGLVTLDVGGPGCEPVGWPR